MGAAARARGDRLIRRLIDDEYKEKQRERGNCREYRYDWRKRTPFSTDGCIRILAHADGRPTEYHFCNQQWKGWDSFSFWYRSLDDLYSAWNIAPVAWQKDTTGDYMTYRILNQWDD